MVELSEPVQVKVSNELLEKVKGKLRLSPDTPAVYVVDTALRQLIEEV